MSSSILALTTRALQAARALATRRISFEVDLIPLHYQGVPLRKIANWLLTESSILVRPSRPWGMPTVLQVEPTTRCNLRCKVCPVTSGLGRPRGEMDLGLYRRLIDELSQHLLLMMFWDWGEPFLHPAAYEMIRYAKRAGIKVMASTNGQLFADPRHARRVVRSGLDVLIFSVDGLDQQTYEQFRDGGRLDRALEGIRQVVAEKRRQGAETPLVNFRYIVTRHGEKDLGRVEAFARELGVDVLTLRRFHAIPGRGEAWDQQPELVPSESRHQLPALAAGTMQPTRLVHNPCKNLWNCPTVHWDGTICSCFMDYAERYPLGSLGQRSLRQIWTGAAYRGLRRGFRRRYTDLPLCGVCSSGFEGGDVGREANSDVVFFDNPSPGARR